MQLVGKKIELHWTGLPFCSSLRPTLGEADLPKIRKDAELDNFDGGAVRLAYGSIPGCLFGCKSRGAIDGGQVVGSVSMKKAKVLHGRCPVGKCSV
jgi:hypothetical protein